MITRTEIQATIADHGTSYRPEDWDRVGCDWCGDTIHIDDATVLSETDEFELAYLCFTDAAELVTDEEATKADTTCRHCDEEARYTLRWETNGEYTKWQWAVRKPALYCLTHARTQAAINDQRRTGS